jgi:excisionase family DNA binding protein
VEAQDSPAAVGPKFETINDACARLGPEPAYVRYLIRKRRIAHYRVGSRIFLRVGELDEFIAQHLVEAS